MNVSRRFFLSTVLGIIVMITFAATGCLPQAGEFFPRNALVIQTRSGPEHFNVELAETPLQRMQGLQDRRTLHSRSGMLFVFEALSPVAMWMKNTYVSLDMLFLDAAGDIVAIVENTRPLSLQPIRPPGPVKAVLELKAGTAEQLGIAIGDRVIHPAFEVAVQ